MAPLKQKSDTHSLELSQLEGEAIAIGSCFASVLTCVHQIISVICIPTGSTISSTKSIIAIFDAHEKPNVHPNGAAFLFFPSVDMAAAYIDNLFYVDPAHQAQQTDGTPQPGTFSSHLLSVAATSVLSEINGALMDASSRSLLYESSADLIQARSQLATLERDLAGARRYHTEMVAQANKPRASRVKPLGPRASSISYRENARDGHQAWSFSHDEASSSVQGEYLPSVNIQRQLTLPFF